MFFFYKGVFWHSAAYVLLMLSIPIGHGWERVRFIFTEFLRSPNESQSVQH